MFKILKKNFWFISKKIKRYLFLKKRFAEVSHFLEDGNYYLNLKKGTVRNNKVFDHKIFFDKFPFIKEMFFSNRNIYFLGKINNEVLKTSFKGLFILFSNKQKTEMQFGELKIFSLADETVLSAFNSQASFDKKFDNTLYFSNFFLVPKIINSNQKQLIIIEELIDFHQPKDKKILLVAHHIIESYIKLFKQSKSEIKSDSLDSIFFNLDQINNTNKETLVFIYSFIETKSLPKNIPFLYQHGDLSLSNILIDKSKSIYFIDFEHSSYFGFLYDIMWFWQNEAINNKNFSMIKYYFEGKFDKKLTIIFQIFSLNYNKSLKLSYILLVISEVIKKRVLNGDPKVSSDFLNLKIRTAVSKIIEISRN
jgi:thiamine kinase-like enzyme